MIGRAKAFCKNNIISLIEFLIKHDHYTKRCFRPQTKIDGNIKELREGLSKIEEKLIIVSPSFINEIKMIKVSDKISSFKKVVTSNTDIKPFEFKALDLQTYIQVKEKMENILSEQLLVSNEIYDLFSFSGKNKEYFDAVLVEYPSIGNDLLMSHEITNKMLPLSLNAFNSKRKDKE